MKQINQILLYLLSAISFFSLYSCKDDYDSSCNLVPSIPIEEEHVKDSAYDRFIINVKGVALTMIIVKKGEDSFLLAETETTEKLYNAVMNGAKGSNMPMTGISVNDWQNFISKISTITNLHFRFPTPNEWEYAAKGGEKSFGFRYSGSNNIDEVAWHKGNSTCLHEVKQLLPNELGLYDMSGNLREMTELRGTFRDYGGDYTDSDIYCRSTSSTTSYIDNIYSLSYGGTSSLRGLRLALSLDKN